jgi:hypothetical protein
MATTEYIALSEEAESAGDIDALTEITAQVNAKSEDGYILHTFQPVITFTGFMFVAIMYK